MYTPTSTNQISEAENLLERAIRRPSFCIAIPLLTASLGSNVMQLYAPLHLSQLVQPMVAEHHIQQVSVTKLPSPCSIQVFLIYYLKHTLRGKALRLWLR
jgi:hypothetical protein